MAETEEARSGSGVLAVAAPFRGPEDRDEDDVRADQTLSEAFPDFYYGAVLPWSKVLAKQPGE